MITFLYLRNKLNLMLLLFLVEIILVKSSEQKSEPNLLDNMLWLDRVSRRWAKSVSKMAINKCEMKGARCDGLVETPSCCPQPGSHCLRLLFLYSWNNSCTC